MTLRSRFSKKPLSVISCINKSKTKYKGLNDFLKNFSHKEMYNKTLKSAADWLSSQFNISSKQALGYMALVGKQAMINANGKISGHANRNFYNVYNDMFSRLRNELNDEIVRHFEEGEYSNKVREATQSPNLRMKLLAIEMFAALQKYHKLEPVKISEQVLRAERRILGWVPAVWSKSGFWILASVFFDVGTAVAGDTMHQTYLTAKGDIDDRLAIELGFGDNARWYDKREYMSEAERVAWRVYDEFIEEVGRELIAAGLSRVVQNAGTRGLRLAGDAVLTIVSSIPSLIGVGGRIALVLKNLANFLDKSILVWLAGQVAIEWQLESWLAMHEWEILRKSRDFWANYTPLSEILGGGENAKEYFKLWEKYLGRDNRFLDWQEFNKFQEYNKRIEDYGGENLLALKRKLFDVAWKLNVYEYISDANRESRKRFNDAFKYLYFNNLDKRINELLNEYNEDYSKSTQEIVGYVDFEKYHQVDDEVYKLYSRVPIKKVSSEGVQVGSDYKRAWASTGYTSSHGECKFIKNEENYFCYNIHKSKTQGREYLTKGNGVLLATGLSIAKYATTQLADIEYSSDYPEEYKIDFEKRGRNNELYSGTAEYKKTEKEEGNTVSTIIRKKIEAVINIPFEPTIIILPLIVAWNFEEKFLFHKYDLRTHKTYKCVRFAKSTPRRIIKVVIYNTNLNDTRFNEDGLSEITLQTSFVNRNADWFLQVGTEIKDYEVSNSNEDVTVVTKNVAVTSGFGSMEITEFITSIQQSSSHSYYIDEDIEDYQQSSTYKKYETENRYHILINKDNPQPKMITLEPIDISPKRTKRAKIICYPVR